MDRITGKIISVEENWLKVQERDSLRMENGDMIKILKLCHRNIKNKQK